MDLGDQMRYLRAWVSEGLKRRFKGILGDLMGSSMLRCHIWELRKFLEVLWGLREIRGVFTDVKQNLKGLQEVFKGVSAGLRGFQSVSRDFRWFSGAFQRRFSEGSKGFKRFQTAGYGYGSFHS